MLYSDWNKHKGRQWRDAEHIVIRTPEKSTHGLDDSSLFFDWLFGYTSEDVCLVLSRDQMCCVCACKHSRKPEITLEASFFHYFAEAKGLVDADFIIKDKSSGWKLEHALKKFLAEYRESTANRKKSRVGDHVPTVKWKKYGTSEDGCRKKLIVGFIGDWVTEEVQGIEFREVTDAFFWLAKIK
ncbi:hypothetical protein HPP92_005053 [Vanilla planifolia]|uniref:FACT complex subunit SPT16 N-terminal lobe domain-containing protein n=1 Tax=Vanilla planifolia TaxID=51239 RepID=A0A835RNY3_VANPL|nr:hypothetical protein HPP92_005053 [Vanilla planifolia]